MDSFTIDEKKDDADLLQCHHIYMKGNKKNSRCDDNISGKSTSKKYCGRHYKQNERDVFSDERFRMSFGHSVYECSNKKCLNNDCILNQEKFKKFTRFMFFNVWPFSNPLSIKDNEKILKQAVNSGYSDDKKDFYVFLDYLRKSKYWYSGVNDEHSCELKMALQFSGYEDVIETDPMYLARFERDSDYVLSFDNKRLKR